MRTVKETLGNTVVLIQTEDDDIEIVNISAENRPNIIETGRGDEIKNVYSGAKSIIKYIAEDIGNELNNLQTEIPPKQVDIEFNMGFTAQAGIWILGAKNDFALKVKITWDPRTTG